MLSPFFITRGRMGARRAALILMKISHFDRTPLYTALLIKNESQVIDPFLAAVRRGVGSSAVGPSSAPGESGGGDKKSFVPVSASNNSSVGRQSSTAALPSNVAPASLPTQLAADPAASAASRKQPGQTISSPQSGADNDNIGNVSNHSFCCQITQYHAPMHRCNHG